MKGIGISVPSENPLVELPWIHMDCFAIQVTVLPVFERGRIESRCIKEYNPYFKGIGISVPLEDPLFEAPGIRKDCFVFLVTVLPDFYTLKATVTQHNP